MSSNHPDETGCQVNAAQEVASCLVVARSNGPVLLELGKEVLDHMARLVHGLVVVALLPVCAARWNHHRFVGFKQRLNHSVLGVVALIGDHRLSLAAKQQHIGALQVMGLPWRQMKPGGIAQRIRDGVNLGAQAPSAAPDGLAAAPFFAPALCWCARTMVESIMPHSLSASCARVSNTRCHTPERLQREWRR